MKRAVTFSIITNSWRFLRRSHSTRPFTSSKRREFSITTAAWEIAVKNADEIKLKKWYSNIAHIGTHNAYHTGQILYIRKMKGWWDDNNGIK